MIAVSMSNDESVTELPMGTYRCCSTYCDCIVDCQPIALLDIVSGEDMLSPIHSETLPFMVWLYKALSVSGVVVNGRPST